MVLPAMTGHLPRLEIQKARADAHRRDRRERIARRRVLLIIESLRAATPIQQVARRIIERGAMPAMDVVPINEVFSARLKAELPRLVRDTYQRAGEATEAKLKSRLVRKDVSFRTKVLSWGFDVLNPRGLEFLRRHGADRVTRITGETRLALQRLLGQMYEQGTPPVEQARRIKSMVGLTEQHAVAVERLRERLIDTGTAPARVESLVARKIRQLTDLRALNIARTELAAAAAAGRAESWRQAADDGLFNRADAVRVWETAEDEQTCPICEPMDGQESDGIDGVFLTGDGEAIHEPPAHVNCRCDVGLRL